VLLDNAFLVVLGNESDRGYPNIRIRTKDLVEEMFQAFVGQHRPLDFAFIVLDRIWDAALPSEELPPVGSDIPSDLADMYCNEKVEISGTYLEIATFVDGNNHRLTVPFSWDQDIAWRASWKLTTRSACEEAPILVRRRFSFVTKTLFGFDR